MVFSLSSQACVWDPILSRAYMFFLCLQIILFIFYILLFREYFICQNNYCFDVEKHPCELERVFFPQIINNKPILKSLAQYKASCVPMVQWNNECIVFTTTYVCIFKVGLDNIYILNYEYLFCTFTYLCFKILA